MLLRDTCPSFRTADVNISSDDELKGDSMTLKEQRAILNVNRVPKCDFTKNKFVKLWDLVPFSRKASLEKGPCEKLPLNYNSQPKYKG